jgi:hypothetical protein
VDAGFKLGLDSGFETGTHGVFLFGFEVLADGVIFDFRSDAPDLSDYRWLFQASFGEDLGVMIYAAATPIAGGPEDPDRGIGCLAVGEVNQIALDPGVYEMDDPPRIEPALLQDLQDTFARSVVLANAARRNFALPRSRRY